MISGREHGVRRFLTFSSIVFFVRAAVLIQTSLKQAVPTSPTRSPTSFLRTTAPRDIYRRVQDCFLTNTQVEPQAIVVPKATRAFSPRRRLLFFPFSVNVSISLSTLLRSLFIQCCCHSADGLLRYINRLARRTYARMHESPRAKVLRLTAQVFRLRVVTTGRCTSF